MKKDWIEKKIASIVKIIERFDNKLIYLMQKYDTNELYLDKSSTCISSPETITALEITYHSHDTLHVQHRLGGKIERWVILPQRDEDGELYLWGAYEFAQDIGWYRKCIRNAVRFYESEDQDRFLESDGDEDE